MQSISLISKYLIMIILQNFVDVVEKKKEFDYQLLIKYQLLTNPDGSYVVLEGGKVPYKIIDGTGEKGKEKVFKSGIVDFNEDEQKMVVMIFDGYCEWYAKNKNIVADFYRRKKS